MSDITIRNEGSVVAFTPHTPAAVEWFDENVASEDWQWLGPSLVVDHRYARDLFEVLAQQFDVEVAS